MSDTINPDDLEIERILKMSESELLAYILDFPSVLCDSYYRSFNDAILIRHTQLTT